ncbi:hypothetical protein ABVF61_06445 [Roseibium sp. HPY-6]|uniref:hypothetical protein n=1 Tax=Roseibium sp. HPY-6 TaxID=3229852 RepID=UPI00262CA422|nr:hypothetical protein [uncultured Roseibium sp.]
MKDRNVKKQAAPSIKGSENRDSGLYQTVRRDIQSLQHAAENTTNDKWISIRRSIATGKFANAKK